MKKNKIGSIKRGIIGLVVMLVVSVGLIFGTNAITDWADSLTAEKPAGGLIDGTYHAEDADFGKSGYKAFVDMEVKNGAIVKLSWDEWDKDGNTKSVLSTTGKYVMTEDGPVWDEQAKAVCEYYIKNGTNGLNLNEEGKTDAISGVSINIQGFINLVEDCIRQASGEASSNSGLKDGTYHAEDADFGKSGYKAFVDMEVKNGAIVKLSWDEWDKDGNTKSVLSTTGKYVMTEDGPVWDEQAKAVCEYYIKNGTNGLNLNEEGKTDAISGVSINIQGFIALVEDCIKQASGDTAPSTVLKDGTYHAEDADFGKSGYKAFVDMEVKNGAIVKLSWDEWDKDGNTKSVLSTTGKYVMTEDGPVWDEQAKAVCEYYIKNGTNGLNLNEEGKTDAISGVSINIQGFINLVEDCIRQASGEASSNSGLKDGTYHAEDADFSKSGYKAFVDMEVKNGAIVKLSWDEWDKDGNTKSVLSTTGKYVMTEDGPTWNEQAKAVCEYYIKNGTNGLNLNEEGKTDAISGVSINIQGFINLVEDCIRQASGEASSNSGLKDGTYHAEDADFGKSGYKAFVDMEVKNGAIVKLSWDEWDKDGNTKSVLSTTGKYVMTEDGPVWDEQAKAVCEYYIKNGANGLNLNEEGKTDAISGVSINIQGFIALVEDCIRQASGEASSNSGLKDGTYHAEDADFGKSGYKAFVDMEVKNGAIVKLSWDEWDKDGNTKSVLSTTGKYVMTEDGPVWDEQAKAVCEYYIKNGTNGLNLNEEGKTDAISGVSINIQGFIALVEDCIKQASGDTAPSTVLKDGTYHAEDADFGKSGYKAFVDMEVKNGAIVKLSWDEWDKDGNTKSMLSTTGKYVMTEDGPVWDEQAKAVCEYYIKNGTNGLNLNEEGKTDAISGVSINIQGFIALVEDCIKQASGDTAPSTVLKDGTYHAEDADFGKSGYKAFVDMEVKNGAIVKLSWDEWDKDGNTKSVLSTTGKYVMTEDGPVWDEQAKAVCEYYIKNGTNGLNLNEEGKTDAISGVSINIQGFIALVEECLAQAA